VHYDINPSTTGFTRLDLGNGCFTYDFDAGFAFDAGPSSAILASAGTLTISSPSQQLVLPPDSGYFSYGGAPLFSAGDLVTISATGAEVPAFNTSITAPAAVVVTGLPSDGGALLIDRQSGYTVTWTGATSDVYVELVGGNVFIFCQPPAGASSQVFPPSALAGVPDGGTAQLAVFAEKLSVFHAGPWPVNLTIANGITSTLVNFQ
jgi:hypothetical protein